MSRTTPGRVAIVGTGARAETFTRGIAGRAHLALVALCDPSPTRMAFHNAIVVDEFERPAASTWAPEAFAAMLREERVDTVVVTTVDALHDAYIVPALEAGVRVITEKPMVTSPDKARRVLDAVESTGGELAVAFNYRFNPVHVAVREIIAAGEIGEVVSVHFEWLLDTHHGADYFRRWHRRKENSGGLMVHKSGHHFDLVNWWLGAAPAVVYGQGRLAFYGADNGGARRGLRHDYERAHGSPAAADDPFALRLADNPALRGLYLDAEPDNGYQRDRNVFNDDITIEDDMAVLVTYDTGATMTYHLTAYSPWEGYRVMVNGTGGRLELDVEESLWAQPHTLADTGGVLHGEAEAPHAGGVSLRVRPLWAPPREVDVEPAHGGHGGADHRLLAALFDPGAPFRDLVASARDGANAQLTGFAANASFASGRPVELKTLLEA